MNKYFINITKNLNDIQSLTKNYENHISKIVLGSFYFKSVSLDDIKKEVLNLNPKRPSTSGTIPVTILKQTIEFTRFKCNKSYTANKLFS